MLTMDSEPKLIWRYHREYSEQSSIQPHDPIAHIQNKPFVLLIDLRGIRYILPEDRDRISQKLLTHFQDHPPIELVYLVDFRNFHRMRMLISLNQLPNAEMVFKYEVDAHDYLDSVILKFQRLNIS